MAKTFEHECRQGVDSETVRNMNKSRAMNDFHGFVVCRAHSLTSGGHSVIKRESPLTNGIQNRSPILLFSVGRKVGTVRASSGLVLYRVFVTPEPGHGDVMPNARTLKRVTQSKQAGQTPATQASAFVKETIQEMRAGKLGAKSTKQAIAIGLSKARRAGVDLPPPRKGTTSEKTRKSAERAYKVGQEEPDRPVNLKRSKATIKALQREGNRAVSHAALSAQASEQARLKTAEERSAIGRKAARTRLARKKNAGRKVVAKKRVKAKSRPREGT
jgi:hypothetical protein